MKTAWFLLVAAAAAGQTPDQTGGLQGVVTDAVTRMPLKRALVTVNPIGNSALRNRGMQAGTTDAGGSFSIANIPPGQYRVTVEHHNYPQPRGGPVSKRVEIKTGETTGPLNLELMPAASLTGRVVDEEGDPLPNCNIQPHPVKHPDQGVQMKGSSPSNEDGEYRMFGIAPGKYIVSVQCLGAVFQPRAFSAGPDPPASTAYPVLYYPSAKDSKSADTVELSAGTEKSGIDFQMRSAAVTQVRGVFSPTGADWHGSQLNLQLLTPEGRDSFMLGAVIDRDKGTFQFHQVFPGSYIVSALSNGPEDGRIGVWQRIDVGDQPMQLAIELRRAADLVGRVEIDSGGNSINSFNPTQIQVMLIPQSLNQQLTQGQVSADGSFTLKGMLPGIFRLGVNAPNAYLKSAWLGSTDVTNAPIDLSAGAAGALRIVVSTDTPTIRGSAPAGETVFAARLDPNMPFQSARLIQADPSGQYTFQGLAPGKYRLVVMDPGGPMPEEGGEEVTVREGETVVLDLKAPSQ